MVDEKSKFDDDDEIIEIPDLDEETEVNKSDVEDNGEDQQEESEDDPIIEEPEDSQPTVITKEVVKEKVIVKDADKSKSDKDS
ncbi:hypothetical protein KDA00_00005, partial [Candidatus Saccharibacteria bacterium]|nr:hypothetical protein [Candidatus Saccharibacteria bacterium]